MWHLKAEFNYPRAAGAAAAARLHVTEWIWPFSLFVRPPQRNNCGPHLAPFCMSQVPEPSHSLPFGHRRRVQFAHLIPLFWSAWWQCQKRKFIMDLAGTPECDRAGLELSTVNATLIPARFEISWQWGDWRWQWRLTEEQPAGRSPNEIGMFAVGWNDSRTPLFAISVDGVCSLVPLPGSRLRDLGAFQLTF